MDSSDWLMFLLWISMRCVTCPNGAVDVVSTRDSRTDSHNQPADVGRRKQGTWWGGGRGYLQVFTGLIVKASLRIRSVSCLRYSNTHQQLPATRGVSKYISPFLTRSTHRVSVNEPSTCGTDNAAIARRRRSLSLVAVDYQSLLTKNVTMGRTAPYHSVWGKSFRQVHTENSWKPGASDSRALIMTSGEAGQRRERNRQNNAVFAIAAVYILL
jgi:hypothetical protein